MANHLRKSQIISAALAVGSCILIGESSARADSFSSTSVPVNTTDFGILSPTLNPVLAVDTNGSGETINGVTFQSNSSINPGGSGVTFSLAYSDPNAQGGNNGAGVYGSFTANQAIDTNIHSLLTNFYYPEVTALATDAAGANVETLTITGLTNGQKYDVTLYNSPFSQGATTGRLVDLTGLNGGATAQYQENNGTLSTLTYEAAASGGQIAFKAAADDGADGLHVYGFTVTAVPEPASLGVLSFGTLALITRRRRV